MYQLLKNLLFKLDPESAHNTALALAKAAQSTNLGIGLTKKLYNRQFKNLETEFLGHTITNPVGLSAGFDKNAECLNFMSALGFGFIEVGSITANEAKGNPLPRAFRLKEDQALINRIGLANKGVEEIQKNFSKISADIFWGANIAKTPQKDRPQSSSIEDYVISYKKLLGKCKFITLNISCPNTSDGKTFADKDLLTQLLSEISSIPNQKQTPLLVKVSNDSTSKELEQIIDTSLKYDVSGFVISNTSSKREGLKTNRKYIEEIGMGGLSGKPIKDFSLALVKKAYRITEGKSFIVGVGGISSANDVLEFIESGANVVELYTAMVYEGPGLIKKINTDLHKLMEDKGYDNIKQAIGRSKQ